MQLSLVKNLNLKAKTVKLDADFVQYYINCFSDINAVLHHCTLVPLFIRICACQEKSCVCVHILVLGCEWM